MTETERSEWSVPERELMAHVRDRLDADEPAMLATVVDVEGSAYRRPGAKMVVSPSKGGVGAITAGCLESEVKQLAEKVLDDGEPTVKTFDLTGDDDVWGFGVGCNGVIDVLLEPLDESIRPAVEAYERGEESTVATVVASDADGVSVGDRATDDFEDLPDEVEAMIRAADVEKSRTVSVETDAGTVSVFVDRISPPAELVVVGSGHDVSPIVDLALNVDFRVTVVTFRGADGAKERFPDADRVVATSPRSLTDDVTFDANTHVVVMSHNFIDDRLALESLLETDVPYVGMMGPKERFEEMLEAFEEEGVEIPATERKNVYTPVGLDLGGGAPYQVAHSVVGEALAVRNGRSGGHLREGTKSVHDRATAE
ncbi:XdhC/CoxI family protein [Haladaptatus sp. DYF46]|uniref:XdhC family protein n=1 Tax=Haladaptatus sp. DYF46 TaxID=2886041 RepID=UPI001E452466|nr:XdhC/CoxI family protein [Haladaptatus sp. DYF46]